MVYMETGQEEEPQTTNPLNYKGIRLRKTQKGYTWDIFINSFDIAKLKLIDNTLKEEWGADD